ncbi:hypothetical protein A2738_00330 [Candidatus Nomurabacteria bacterium RIFCSPHIGHO2_01_FULL_42_15]|uniref:DUF5671 domain-containing protein n=1 Tax=Candidatus Nomurabacteria bacterium RIFCSPHIGHO2_01_FULL_42_15 TaxID=1801742 RepID=A0A1F6VEE7_9BACT|nr:MAG: hypothetical protein A2738_00330 [Candidatus Nomurabacteria bacterium RIFCSPHIGHO2_01_FULL_42_15]OGI93261.1 MAG: hypothetical protein A3A99_03915 [Candidatus Nomurabacteria bacterium RIFCSPLOWO2_01_FULL_41_18]
MDLENTLGSFDSLLSPNLVWMIFSVATLAGILMIFLLRYHWNQYLFGGEFVRFGLIKGIFLGVLGILWIILFIIAIIFTVQS